MNMKNTPGVVVVSMVIPLAGPDYRYEPARNRAARSLSPVEPCHLWQLLPTLPPGCTGYEGAACVYIAHSTLEHWVSLTDRASQKPPRGLASHRGSVQMVAGQALDYH